MKLQYLLSAVFAVVVIIVLVVFFKDDIFTPDAVLTSEQQKAMQLLNIAQQACLSGEQKTAAVGVNLDTELRKKIGANASIESTSAQGAVTYLDESMRNIADEKIRACLDEHMPQIKACLMGNCEQAALPKVIDFQFSYNILDTSLHPYFYLDRLEFNVQYRSKPRYFFLADNENYYVDSIEMLNKNESRLIEMSNMVKDAVYTKNATQVCLQRASQLPRGQDAFTRFKCNDTQGCTADNMTPQWFALCPLAAPESFDTGALTFFRRAYAQENESSWAVPSLETLNQRMQQNEMQYIGYTHFTLSSQQPLNVNADSFYMQLDVNGQSIFFNGLSPSFNAVDFDAAKPFNYEFALQNLSFSGEREGCETMQMSVHFLKDRQPVGKPFKIERSYIALRDAKTTEHTMSDTLLRWSGRYKRASKEYDNQVFINSIFIDKSLDFAANKEKIEQAKVDINKMKQNFDKKGLRFQDQPLIAVIRPPLTGINYSLAVAVLEPSGQLRFTFSYEKAVQLKDYLLELRKNDGSLRRVIDRGSFVYTMRSANSDDVSPPICFDDII